MVGFFLVTVAAAALPRLVFIDIVDVVDVVPGKSKTECPRHVFFHPPGIAVLLRLRQFRC